LIPAAWICLFLPLAATLAITLAGNRISRRGAGYLATLSVAGSFAAAVAAFVDMLGKSPADRSGASTAWSWLTAGSLHFGLTILVDPLSVFMMLIVAGVGALIVGYSIGYMDGEDEERRYFAYMALFVFSMLALVEAGNLLILLAGWGLVGLCSYLLIGFHHERPSAVAAAKKAFIMNAIGDATFALSLFLLIQHTGSLDMSGVSSVFESGTFISGSTIADLVALGLLGGAVAKSAQIPLHTWLPDAMEGPTPVSALIHAATMVTAGVYLIVRTHALFELAPKVQDVAAGLGAATLLMAGLIALVQTDIKRVIAYSTMSQIGYMFLGAGIGAYANSMFHLMTHAFFKALLFLAAGIVIHALAGEQDMRKMGGLRRLLPKTAVAMWIGGLALVGVPPFAGFFSKDSILAAALAHGWYGVVLWVCGMAGAFLTGLYTFRMIFLVFGGEPSAYVREHPPHVPEEAAPRLSMAWAVGALAVLSVVGGWLQFAGVWTTVSNWLDPVAKPLVTASGTQEAISSIFAVGFGLAGIAAAWWIYVAKKEPPPKPSPVLEKKLYFDELYDALFYRPAVFIAKALFRGVEGPIVAGSVTGVAGTTRALGRSARELQTGLVRTYVFALAAGLAVLVVVFVAVK
jgi:NADH-quinone oxidoreductase subunit L